MQITHTHTKEQKDLVKKYLAKVITILNEGNKIEFQTVNNINIQHKIKPQIRLYSTKKKVIKKSYFKTFNK